MTATRRLLAKGDELWAAFQVSDPGLLRWYSAWRTTLSVVLVTAGLGLLTQRGWVPHLAPAVGAVFCMMSGAFPREFSVRARLVTIVMAALASAASVTLGAVLDAWPFVGDSAFVVVLIGAVACQSLGPRAIACGFVAVINIYLVLFLRADVSQIVPTLLTLPVAVAVVCLVHFVVMPDRPARVLTRIIRVVERRGSILLRAMATMTADHGAERMRARRLLGQLNEGILAAEDQMVVIDPARANELSLAMMRFEVVLSNLAATALLAQPLAKKDRVRLRLTAMRLNVSHWSPLKPGREGDPSPIFAGLVDVEAAALAMAGVRRHDAGSFKPPPASVPKTPRPPLAWRAAARAGVAAVLSIIGGSLLSPNRWFWATLTVYIMSLGARSRGDTLQKGFQRVFGTLIGLVAGILVGLAVSGHLAWEIGTVLLCVFATTYVFAVSQVLAVFCVTVLLGVVYSLLGYHISDVLLLRLEETAVGALAAGFVSLLVFPQRTIDHIGTTARRLLAALAGTVRLSAERIGGDRSASPIMRMRDADRLLRDLRAAVRPLQAQRSFSWWMRIGTDMPAVLLLIVWVRVLATAVETSDPHPDDVALRDRLLEIAAHIDRLATSGGDTTSQAAHDGDDERTPVPQALPIATRLRPVVDNLDTALTLLRDRLSRDGWSALALRRPL